MNKPNYYWPVYKNLEKEVLNLSTEIHFSDEIKKIEGSLSHCQLYTYSIKIAELLYRICAEIESISKALYKQEGGEMKPKNKSGMERDLLFDTDCIKFLNELWDLDKKEVIVTAPSFYFFKDENKILTPLDKADKRKENGSDWKQAYQAVKHERVEELHRANVKHLVRALAALFLLNVYFKNEEKLHGVFRWDSSTSLGSEIFSVKIHGPTFGVGSIRHRFPQLPKCTYMMRYTGKLFNAEMKEEAKRQEKFIKEAETLLKNTEELKEFFANGGKYSVENLPAMVKEAGKSLVLEMNKLKTFEEKKSFVINHPKYNQAKGSIPILLKQVFPDQKINFKNGDISKNNIEQICTIIGTFAFQEPIHEELNKSEAIKSIPLEKLHSFQTEVVLNKNQELFLIT